MSELLKTQNPHQSLLSRWESVAGLIRVCSEAGGTSEAEIAVVNKQDRTATVAFRRGRDFLDRGEPRRASAEACRYSTLDGGIHRKSLGVLRIVDRLNQDST